MIWYYLIDEVIYEVVSTSLKGLELNRVAWWTFIAVIGHYYVDLVVAVGDEAS